MAEFSVELRTRHLPTLRFTEGDLKSDDGFLTRLAKRLLRPGIFVRTPFGTWSKAPEGDPGETTWPLLLVPIAVGLVVLLLLVVNGVRALFRP